jgi:hypothetical protein
MAGLDNKKNNDESDTSDKTPRDPEWRAILGCGLEDDH